MPLPQEDDWSTFRSSESGRRLPVVGVLGEGRRIVADVLGDGVDSILVVRVVRQQLRDFALTRVLEILEEPHQSPRVVSSLGTNVGAGQVRLRLRLAGIPERAQLPEQGNREDVRTRRAHQHGGSELLFEDSLLLLRQSDTIAMNSV